MSAAPLILHRDPFDASAPSTMGQFLLGDGWQTLQTIERPWNDNKGDIAGVAPDEASCVYPGVYDLLDFTRPDGTECWALFNPDLDVYLHKADIPQYKLDDGLGRYLVLIHKANWVTQIIGCIAPGLSRGKMRNPDTGSVEMAVKQSGAAMNLLRQYLGSKSGKLTLDIRQANAPSKFN